MLRNDAVKLCQENNFNSGFFEGNDNNGVVDAYELKVRFSVNSCDLTFLLNFYRAQIIPFLSMFFDLTGQA